MVQDSYSPGHVARDNEGNIKAFLDASKQQYWDYHRENDNYLDANNKIKPEAKEAGSATAKLIDYYYDNAEWEKVKTYLDTEVFKGVDKNTKVGIPKLESSDNN